MNDDDMIADAYKQAKKEGIPAMPISRMLRPVIDFVWPLIGVLYLDLPAPADNRKPKRVPLNEANFTRKEFQELWSRINHRAVYQIEFDSAGLIHEVIMHLSRRLNVTALQYIVRAGRQRKWLRIDNLTSSSFGFVMQAVQIHTKTMGAHSQMKYDPLGEITEKTQLARRTIAAILSGVIPGTLTKFRLNPGQLIIKAAWPINE